MLLSVWLNSQTLQSALESGRMLSLCRLTLVQPFDRVNHPGIIHLLWSVGIEDLCCLYLQLFSNRSQHVMGDGYRSILVNVVSGVPHGRIFGHLLYLLYTSQFFFIPENKFVGYGNDFTLIVVVPSSGIRVAVAESLNRDLGKATEWCDILRKKSNASNAKSMISLQVTHIAWPVTHPLTLGVIMLKKSDDLDILGGLDICL